MSILRADNLTNRDADGAPLMTHGVRVTGVVTANSANFSGDVSIGGTLTYQDLTNLDSVGLVTARTGVRVTAGGVDISGGGLNVTGISTFNDNIVGDNATNISGINSVTATSFSGNGANLSGIEFGVRNFVASGTIANGDTVVVNTDGTVSVVDETVLSTPTIGSPVEYRSTNTQFISATYDSTNQKVVIAHRGKEAIVGTVSGTSISFGTAAAFTTDSMSQTGIVHDSDNNRVVVVYNGNTSGNPEQGRAVVGTISGDSISFGTPVRYASGAAPSNFDVTYDSTNGKVVIAYNEATNNGTAIVGTVSGTSISFGTAVAFESATTNSISATFDSTNSKVVIAYSDAGNSNYGTAVVGTVSGTSISFGTPVVFSGTSGVDSTDITYDSTNEKVVIAYRDTGNSNYGTAIVGTVSGDSISFGTPVVFESASSTYNTITYDPDGNRVIIVYRDGGNSNYATVIVGTVSGTSISFGTPVVFSSNAAAYFASSYDSSNKRLVTSFQNAANGPGVAVVIKNIETNLTTKNYVGLAAEAISDGATGKVSIFGGINESQSGLTTARKHYVQSGGGIGLTTSTPSVVAGTSISDTKIIVKG